MTTELQFKNDVDMYEMKMLMKEILEQVTAYQRNTSAKFDHMALVVDKVNTDSQYMKCEIIDQQDEIIKIKDHIFFTDLDTTSKVYPLFKS